jgi:hypothetical protein
MVMQFAEHCFHQSPSNIYELNPKHVSQVNEFLTATPQLHQALFSAGYPEYDGGAPLSEFEVEMTSPNSSRQQAYRGKDTECIVTDLSPGQTYVFQVRAFNRVGVSISCCGIHAAFNIVFCKSNYIACVYKINAETEVD